MLMSENELVSRKYREPFPLSKKINNLIKNGQNISTAFQKRKSTDDS